MGFKIVFDTMAEVPDGLKTVAKDVNGVAEITALPSGWEIGDLTGLTTALNKERDRASKAESVLRGFGEISPTQAKDALKRLAELAKDDPDGKIKTAVAEREARMLEAHQQEMGNLSKDRDYWRNLTVNSLLDRETDAAIEAHKGNKTLLRPLVRSMLKANEENGKIRVVVVDENGIPRVGGAQNGQAVDMTPAQWVGELRKREDLAPAFAASGASGTGAVPPTGSGKPGSGLENMNPSERLRHLRSQPANT